MAPKVRVIAGVVVAVATLPETPLAVVTETEVTVPEVSCEVSARVPVEVGNVTVPPAATLAWSTVEPLVEPLKVTEPLVPPFTPVVIIPDTPMDVALATPSAGVTRVGEVAKTTEPEPVVAAALIAVPLPERMPVTVVESVIAGVVVAVATVPAKPLADTTDTLVTLPPLPGMLTNKRCVTGSA